jgi:integrase
MSKKARRRRRRRPDEPPPYCGPHASGQAYSQIGPRYIYHGKHGTPESYAAYDRFVAAWRAGGEHAPLIVDRRGLRINDLILLWDGYARQHFVGPDGRQTEEYVTYKRSIRPLRHLYGDTAIADFGPLALQQVRQLMLDGYEHPHYGPQRPLSRAIINARINRIRRFFKWGVAQEAVPVAVYEALRCVPALRAGKTPAPDPRSIPPVAWAVVEATLPRLSTVMRATVLVQYHAGMRPGEVLRLRPGDIWTTYPDGTPLPNPNVWLYLPGSLESGGQGPGRHKTAHHGHRREVWLGPQAQTALEPLLAGRRPEEYVFSPVAAVAESYATRRAARGILTIPSQKTRKPGRPPGSHYRVNSYAHAIYRACDDVFLPTEPPLARQPGENRAAYRRRLTPAQRAELHEWQRSHRWHPNQLRHLKATEIERAAGGPDGMRAAALVLGDRTDAVVSKHYVERDREKAAQIAGAMG